MKALITITFIVLSTMMSAQSNTTISGKVVDIDNRPIDLVLITLLNQSDSLFVTSKYSDEDGTFVLSNVSLGNYIIEVSMVGYIRQFQPVQIPLSDSDITLDPIQLLQDEQQLDEVTIQAKVPYIQRKIDRVVVTPDALLSNAGSNTLEVLERVPGISIDAGGSIMLKGRSGVAVFINDKPSYLSGVELENYLRSLPAGSIKHIEVMTNPPAKYEAAGNSGVINIIIKRNQLSGFYGNASASVRQGMFTNSNNSLNLNFNKKRISLFANLYAGFYNSFQDLNINRYYKNEADERLSSFSQNSVNKTYGRYVNAKIGLDYFFNDRTSAGFSYKNVNQPSDRGIDNTSDISNTFNEIEQTVVADNIGNASFQNDLYSMYLTHKLDTLGSKISFDADYVNYSSDNNQNFKNFTYNSSGDLLLSDQINGRIPSRIEIYAAKSDFVKPLSDKAQLEAGVKMALTKTDNEAIYSNTINNVTEPNYDLSNRFLYDEWINAGYINYNRSFKIIDIQAGLRVESTQLSGEQLGNIERPDTSFTRSYTSLFPTFYSSWKMDTLQNNVLVFSYGHRIDRPYFQDLNPFISPLDRFTFYTGNPNLLPTFSHNLSLSHSYKGKFNATLNYSKTIDNINETLQIRDGIYYSLPGNISNSESYNLSVDGAFEVTSWYNFNGYIEVGHLKFNSELFTEQLNSKGTYYFFSANNSFQLNDNWRLDLSGRYITDIVSGQLLIKSYGLINFGVQKKFLKGNGNLRLAVNDILYSRRGDGIINNLRLTDADWNSKYDSRNVTLALSYNFGKSSNNRKKHNSSGSDTEQKRVKN